MQPTGSTSAVETPEQIALKCEQLEKQFKKFEQLNCIDDPDKINTTFYVDSNGEVQRKCCFGRFFTWILKLTYLDRLLCVQNCWFNWLRSRGDMTKASVSIKEKLKFWVDNSQKDIGAKKNLVTQVCLTFRKVINHINAKRDDEHQLKLDSNKQEISPFANEIVPDLMSSTILVEKPGEHKDGDSEPGASVVLSHERIATADSPANAALPVQPLMQVITPARPPFTQPAAAVDPVRPAALKPQPGPASKAAATKPADDVKRDTSGTQAASQSSSSGSQSTAMPPPRPQPRQESMQPLAAASEPGDEEWFEEEEEEDAVEQLPSEKNGVDYKGLTRDDFRAPLPQPQVAATNSPIWDYTVGLFLSGSTASAQSNAALPAQPVATGVVNPPSPLRRVTRSQARRGAGAGTPAPQAQGKRKARRKGDE